MRTRKIDTTIEETHGRSSALSPIDDTRMPALNGVASEYEVEARIASLVVVMKTSTRGSSMNHDLRRPQKTETIRGFGICLDLSQNAEITTLKRRSSAKTGIGHEMNIRRPDAARRMTIATTVMNMKAEARILIDPLFGTKSGRSITTTTGTIETENEVATDVTSIVDVARRLTRVAYQACFQPPWQPVSVQPLSMEPAKSLGERATKTAKDHLRLLLRVMTLQRLDGIVRSSL